MTKMQYPGELPVDLLRLDMNWSRRIVLPLYIKPGSVTDWSKRPV